MYKLLCFFVIFAVALAAPAPEPAPEPEPGAAFIAPGFAYKAPLTYGSPYAAPLAYPAYPAPLAYGTPIAAYPAPVYSKIY